jgi:hypothetical protein
MISSQWKCVLAVLCLLFSVLQPSFADPPLPTPVGRVVWVKGVLTAIMVNKEKRLLQKTSVIYLHDSLVTDANSQAQIVFTDNTLMTFRAGTTFNIDQYEYHPQAKGNSVGKYVMSLIEGGFRTITGLIAKKDPSDYQVNTPVATIGVRGTDYVVYVHNGELFIGYKKGSPCVTNKKNPQTLCLDEKTPYARVPAENMAPVPISQQPDVFKEELKIVAATLAPFQGLNSSSGVITSFCIQ